jgi:polyisoprenoid-binding protein YceI
MIKRFSLTIMLVAILAFGANAETWNLDAVHSSVGFTVKHMVVSKVNGSFAKFDGTVEFDGTNLEQGSVNVTIDVSSVNTNNEKRDNHLKTSDFLDVENYPEMSFKSKSVTAGEDGEFQIVGDLTLRGVTKEVTLEAEFNGTVQDPWGGTRAGFSAHTTIDRQDFGVSFNSALETGGLVVSNDVKINLEIELVKAK